MYFVQREYRYNGDFEKFQSNYDIWTDFYTKSPIGKKIFPYLEKARANSTKTAEGYKDSEKTLALEYYKHWNIARKLMVEEGVDIRDIPETYTEAFLEFIHTTVDRDGNLSYVTIESNYDPNKPILEQSQEAINNLLFDYYQARLEDPDTLSERTTPGGPIQLNKNLPVMMALNYATADELAECESLEDLEDLAIKFIDYSPDYDPTELSTITHYQTYNALYDKLIGVAANQNINQRLTALLNKLKLKTAIKFGTLIQSSDDGAGKDIRARVVNGIDTELLNTEFLSSAVDAVKNALLEFYGIDDNNFNIACLLSKIGASPVDIGLLLNQPVVKRAMAIIKESSWSKNISTALDEALQEDDFSGRNYEDHVKKYNEFNEIDENRHKKRDAYVTSDKLVQYIAAENAVRVGKSRQQEYLEGQYAVAHLMKELVDAATELSDQISISKSTSTNSVQSTLGAIENMEIKVINFINSFGSKTSMYEVEVLANTNSDTGEFIRTIINPFLRFFDIKSAEDMLDKCAGSPYCMEQVAFSSIMNFVDRVIGTLFPYRTTGFTALRTALSALTARNYLSADLCDAVNKDAMLFLIERMTESFNNEATVTVNIPGQEAIESNIPARIFYTEMFPAYFEKIMAYNQLALQNKKTDIDYSKIPILAAISKAAEEYAKGKKSKVTKFYRRVLKFAGIGSLKGYQKDVIIDSWAEMYNSEDGILRDMAKHLFLYSYYSRGFNFGDTSFMSLVPILLKTGIFGGEYATFFNRVFNLSASSDGKTLSESGLGDVLVSGIRIKDFLKAFILNHSAEYQFTKELNSNQKSKLKEEVKERIGINDEEISDEAFIEKYKAFTIDFNKESVSNSSLRSLGTALKNKDGEIVGYKFTPCIKIGDALYICDVDIEGNNTAFNISENKSITYYRMDLPMGLDYSTPQKYGTREATLIKLAKENKELVESINNMAIQNLLSITPSTREPGDDNSHGGEVIYSDVNKACNVTLAFINQLVAVFRRKNGGAPFWHVQEDFVNSLEKALSTISINLDGGIVAEDILEKLLQTIKELLLSDVLKNPMLFYINDLEEALSLGVLVFDFETTHAEGEDARKTTRCGIALIGAAVIKDGKFVDGTKLNTFVTPLKRHNTDAEFVNQSTRKRTVNPIHQAYLEARQREETMDEAKALAKLSTSLVTYQRSLGFNSVSFDVPVLERRIESVRGTKNLELKKVRHFDAMTVARLALDGRGLAHYNRETVVRWLTENKPGFKEMVDSLRELLDAGLAKSHDAMNDIIETYCIVYHLMDELKASRVVLNTSEYAALVQSLKNIQSEIEHQLHLLNQLAELNQTLKAQLDNAPKQEGVCD